MIATTLIKIKMSIDVKLLPALECYNRETLRFTLQNAAVSKTVDPDLRERTEWLQWAAGSGHLVLVAAVLVVTVLVAAILVVTVLVAASGLRRQ